MLGLNKILTIPKKTDAMIGRKEPIITAKKHYVSGREIKPPFPEGMEEIILGMGCFWGVERLFWETNGVWVTAVGYAAGLTPNPTYEEVCTGKTGHNEVVRIVFDPSQVSFAELLRMFWENHDPTQGMRQGNDVGTQYRSGIYTSNDKQKEEAETSKKIYQQQINDRLKVPITTEIISEPTFFYAEEYHQQYLAKNPNGYCNMRGTGISCPMPQEA